MNNNNNSQVAKNATDSVQDTRKKSRPRGRFFAKGVCSDSDSSMDSFSEEDSYDSEEEEEEDGKIHIHQGNDGFDSLGDLQSVLSEESEEDDDDIPALGSNDVVFVKKFASSKPVKMCATQLSLDEDGKTIIKDLNQLNSAYCLCDLTFLAKGDEPDFKGVQFKFPSPLELTCGGNSSTGFNWADKNLSVSYFELHLIQIGQKERENTIGIGFHKSNFFVDTPNQHVGWRDGSIGYHSDDGGVFNDGGWHKKTLETYTSGDVVGMGHYRYNPKGSKLWVDKFFFTKNGKKYEHESVSRFERGVSFYPTVRSHHYNLSGILFKINNGENTVKYPFVYPKYNVVNIFAKKMIRSYYNVTVKCVNE